MVAFVGSGTLWVACLLQWVVVCHCEIFLGGNGSLWRI